MAEYKVKLGFDPSGMQKGFSDMRRSFKSMSADMSTKAKNIGSDLKNNIGAGFRSAGSDSKRSEKEMTSSSQGMQIGLAGMLDSMKMVSAIGKDMLTGFIDASPAASSAMALINFETNQMNRSFGDALAPTLSIIADKFAILSEFVQGLDESTKLAIISALAFVTAGIAIGGVLLAITAIGIPLIATIAAIGVAVALLSLAWTNDFMGMQTAIRAFIDIVSPMFTDLMNLFKTESGGMFKDLSENFDGMSINLVGLAKNFGEFLVKLKPIFDIIIKVFFVVLKDAIQGMIDKFKFFIQVATIIFATFNKLIIGDWAGAWNEFKQIFQVIIDYVVNLLNRKIQMIIDIFNIFGVDIKSIFGGIASFFTGIWGNITDGWDAFIENIERGVSKIGVAIEKIGTFFSNMKSGISASFGFVETFFSNSIDNIVSYFDDMKTDINKVFTDIGAFFSSIFSGIGSDIASIPNLIKGIVNVPIKWINDTLIGSLNSFLSSIKDVNIAGAKPFDWVKTIGTISLLHSGGEVSEAGDYRLQKNEGVLSAQQMRSIGGITGLRQIGQPQQSKPVIINNEVPTSGNQQSGNMTVTIENVSLSGDADIEKFISKLRSQDFDDFGSSGFGMQRY